MSTAADQPMLVLCCRCQHMVPDTDMVDRPAGWTCQRCVQARLLTVYFQDHVLVAGSWQLRRVCDGRGEAGGFTTEAEARSWAAELGYEVADG